MKEEVSIDKGIDCWKNFGTDYFLERREIGCGTGEGAMLACNSFPKVLCGHVTSPLDAYLFSQVNDGNCISMPFAQGFGWGAMLVKGALSGAQFKELFYANCKCDKIAAAVEAIVGK